MVCNNKSCTSRPNEANKEEKMMIRFRILSFRDLFLGSRDLKMYCTTIFLPYVVVGESFDRWILRTVRTVLHNYCRVVTVHGRRVHACEVPMNFPRNLCDAGMAT